VSKKQGKQDPKRRLVRVVSEQLHLDQELRGTSRLLRLELQRAYQREQWYRKLVWTLLGVLLTIVAAAGVRLFGG
jgi:hypothetical protein